MYVYIVFEMMMYTCWATPTHGVIRCELFSGTCFTPIWKTGENIHGQVVDWM